MIAKSKIFTDVFNLIPVGISLALNFNFRFFGIPSQKKREDLTNLIERRSSYRHLSSAAPNLDLLSNWHRTASAVPRVSYFLFAFPKISHEDDRKRGKDDEKSDHNIFNENATRMKRLLKCNKTRRVETIIKNKRMI